MLPPVWGICKGLEDVLCRLGQSTSRTSESLMYVQFTSCVQGLPHSRSSTLECRSMFTFTILYTQEWRVTNIINKRIYYFSQVFVLSSNLHQIGHIEKGHISKPWNWRRHVLINNHSILKRVFENSHVYYLPLPEYLTYIWTGS